MKNLLSIAIVLLLSQTTYAQFICGHEESAPQSVDPIIGLQRGGCISQNGYCHTPEGNLHIMYVYVVFNNEQPDANSSWWPENGVPNFAALNGVPNDLLDINPSSASNNNNLTTWYRNMSAGHFSITGEVFKVSIDRKYRTINGVTNLDYYEMELDVFVALQAQLQNRDLSVFDQRENNCKWNYDNYSFKSDGSIAGGDGKIDYVVINYRLPPSQGIAGGASLGHFTRNTLTTTVGGVTKTYGMNVGHSAEYMMDKTLNSQFFTHEFAHNLYDAPHYMGANSLAGQHLFTNKGWGMMSYLATMHTTNAWEKWLLGWIDMSTRTIIANTSGIVLKDFVTKNDAIRIAIPNTTPQQYLWLENHQKIDVLDNKIYYQDIPMGKGIFAFISSNGDNCNDKYSFMFQSNSSTTNLFKVLTKKGNNDYSYTTLSNGINSYTKVSDNPVSGESVFSMIRKDYNNDNLISYCKDPNSHYYSCPDEQFDIIVEDGIVTNAFSGTVDDPFTTGDEISLNGIVPALNYPTYNETTNQLNDFSLNGIKVKIVSYDAVNGEYTLDVNFNEYVIKENKRFSSFISLPNITANNDADLIIASGKTLLINKSGTVNTTRKYSLVDNTEFPDFIKPTVFTCKENSFVKLEANSSIQVYEGSTFKMEPNSKLEIENGATLIISDNSVLDLADNVEIIVHPGGKIFINDGSRMIYNPNVSLTLLDNSFIEVSAYSKIEIAENATFTWTGKGYLKINTNTWGLSNIVASGPNAKFYKAGAGFSPFDEKLIEITGGGSLSIDKSLAEFKLHRGYVLMDQGTLLDVEPKMKCTFVKFTSNNINTKHAGIIVYGQQNEAYLDNCIVENAGWGILVLNNSGTANQAKIVASKFINNDIGIYIQGKGADISYCNFWKNKHAAVQLDMLTLPAKFYKVNAEGNGYGLLSNTTNFSLISIVESKIFQNNIGVQATAGTLTLGCSKVYNNFGPNIYARAFNTVGIEPARWANAGNNYLYNDFTTSIELDKAWDLFANKGKNHFQVNTSYYTPQTIHGQFKDEWWRKRKPSIIANQNYWNIGGTSPVMQASGNSNDYFLSYNYNSNPVTLTIIDGTPLTVAPTFADCGASGSLPGNNDDLPSVLIGKPSLTLSNSIDATDYFMTGMHKLYVNNDYAAAVSIFKLIAEHEYNTDNTIELPGGDYISEKDLWQDVVYAAYEKMLESLTTGISQGVISDYSTDPETYEEIIGTQTHLIDGILADDSLAYEFWFKLSLDNAIIYKLMDDLDVCKTKITTITNAHSHTNANSNILEHAYCTIDNEIKLRDTLITKLDYAVASTACAALLEYTYPTTTLNVGVEPADPIEEGFMGKKGNDKIEIKTIASQVNNDVIVKDVLLYPNPTNGVVYVNANGNKIESINLYNALGLKLATYSEVTSLILTQPGLYIFEIKTDSKVYYKKVVVN